MRKGSLRTASSWYNFRSSTFVRIGGLVGRGRKI